MIDPIIMMIEPYMIEPRRPTQLSTIGMKGREIIAPSEYAAAMMPFSEPCGLPKSANH
jgi:hypothetical protein